MKMSYKKPELWRYLYETVSHEDLAKEFAALIKKMGPSILSNIYIDNCYFDSEEKKVRGINKPSMVCSNKLKKKNRASIADDCQIIEKISIGLKIKLRNLKLLKARRLKKKAFIMLHNNRPEIIWT